jgi:hypothetical protein
MSASTYLIIGRYPSDSPFHKSDQVTVPVPIWEELYGGHEGGERPVFVQLNASEDGPFARLRPAVGVGLSADSCQMPEWMWLLLGAPGPGSDTWVSLTVSELPDAGSVKLRPRRAATLTTLSEPLVHLTEELTGGVSGQSWACLSAGAELPLVCGAFDVLEITSIEGYPVPAACILNLDVDLELEPALDARPATPPALLSPSAVGGTGDATTLLRAAAQARASRAAPQGMSFPGMEMVAQPDTRFPGTGHRLGGP